MTNPADNRDIGTLAELRAELRAALGEARGRTSPEERALRERMEKTIAAAIDSQLEGYSALFDSTAPRNTTSEALDALADPTHRRAWALAQKLSNPV